MKILSLNVFRLFQKVFLLCILMCFSTIYTLAVTQTASLDSIMPNTASTFTGGGPDPEGAVLIQFMGTPLGTTYTAVFNVSAQPAMVVMMAADIQSWSYDEFTQKVTVHFKHVGFVPGAQDPFAPDSIFNIAFVWPAENESDDAPPAAMIGCYMSTDIVQWELILPDDESLDEDDFGVGFKLYGPEGQTGFFRMFIPQTMIDYMKTLLGVDALPVDDLAIFNDEKQASLDITEVAGGIYVSVNVLFSDLDFIFEEEDDSQYFLKSSLSSSYFAESDDVSKKITVNKQLPISITTNSKKVIKNDQASISGWLDNASGGENIDLLRKKKGETKYKKWKKAQGIVTDSSGYFNYSFTAKKTARYKFKYKPEDGKSNKSKNIKIKVSAS